MFNNMFNNNNKDSKTTQFCRCHNENKTLKKMQTHELYNTLF